MLLVPQLKPSSPLFKTFKHFVHGEMPITYKALDQFETFKYIKSYSIPQFASLLFNKVVFHQ